MKKRPKVGRCYHTQRGRATLSKMIAAMGVPSTREEISIVSGMSVDTVKTCLRLLKSAGRIHIGGYRGAGRDSKKLWMAGPGSDVTYKKSVGKVDMAVEPEVIEALREGATRAEISEIAGVGQTAAKRRISQVREWWGLHVCGFRQQTDQQAPAPVYKIGAGKDAVYISKPRSEHRKPVPKKPRKPRTVSQKAARRVVPEQEDEFVREVRVVKATTTGTVFRDPWSAALFGEYQGARA